MCTYIQYDGTADPITPLGSSIVTILTSDHSAKVINTPIALNIIYLGYLIDHEPQYLATKQFLRINEDNTIDTYITKLFDKKRFHNIDPCYFNEMFLKFYEKTNKEQISFNASKYGRRDKNGKPNEKFENAYSKINKIKYEDIFDSYFNYIMNDTITQDEIECLLIQEYYLIAD